MLVVVAPGVLLNHSRTSLSWNPRHGKSRYYYSSTSEPLGIYTPTPIQTVLAIRNFFQTPTITHEKSWTPGVPYNEVRLCGYDNRWRSFTYEIGSAT